MEELASELLEVKRCLDCLRPGACERPDDRASESEWQFLSTMGESSSL
jgi:hypothetical protein